MHLGQDLLCDILRLPGVLALAVPALLPGDCDHPTPSARSHPRPYPSNPPRPTPLTRPQTNWRPSNNPKSPSRIPPPPFHGRTTEPTCPARTSKLRTPASAGVGRAPGELSK